MKANDAPEASSLDGVPTACSVQASAGCAFDAETARNYVLGLFVHILDRARVGEDELAHWADYLQRTNDPIGTFNRFVQSEEGQQRMRLRTSTRTAYPPGHFYSPVVDRDEITANHHRIFGPRTLPGIDLRSGEQEQLFKLLAPHFANMPFLELPGGHDRYHYLNSSYNFGDACIYWSMLAHLRPARIVEVGCGYSSAFALDAIDHLHLDTHCTFVDPYPSQLQQLSGPLDPRHVVLAEPVQAVGSALAASLHENDLLFIDSSHVVKSGSDVVYEITEMLPKVRRGVVVHFHDVFYPFEYPEAWVLDDNKSWNELYMLHAFLMFNDAFEVLFFNDHFAKTRRDVVIEHAGPAASRILLNPGGGLWLRRV